MCVQINISLLSQQHSLAIQTTEKNSIKFYLSTVPHYVHVIYYKSISTSYALNLLPISHFMSLLHNSLLIMIL